MRARCFSVLALMLAAAPAAAQDHSIQVVSSGRVVAAGSTFNLPAGIEGAGGTIAYFTQSNDRFSIKNMGDAPVTVQRIVLTRAQGVIDEEFALMAATIKVAPLSVADQVVPPEGTLDFGVRLFPVIAGPRRATITIIYDGGKEFAFGVQGTGHPAGTKFLEGASQPSQHLLLGGRETDSFATGMVTDGAGNAYLLWQEIGLADTFAFDLALARVNADGTRAWAKVWNGKFRDASPDCGQNNETGGAAGAIDIDEQGFVYVVASVSPANQNNDFGTLVMKVEPDDGSIVWEMLWRPEWPKTFLAKHNATAYGLDVAGGRVFVTGATGAAVDQAEAFVSLLALDAADGSLKVQRAIEVNKTVTDRGYCVRADGSGGLYVGGSANASGFVMKLTDAGAEPKLAWARSIDLGRGSSVNSLDVDAQGNLYLGCDRRGATTFASVVKLTSEGALAWGKTIPSNPGTGNQVHVVRVIGDDLWVGGKLTATGFDTTAGDGLLVHMNAADGAMRWTGLYYTGTGPDEVCEHRVKGLAVVGDSLVVMGQVYSGNDNGVRYHGYWYDRAAALEAYAPALAAVSIPADQLLPIATGAVRPATESRSYGDAPAALVLQEATTKHDGKAPDGDIFLMRLQLR